MCFGTKKNNNKKQQNKKSNMKTRGRELNQEPRAQKAGALPVNHRVN